MLEARQASAIHSSLCMPVHGRYCLAWNLHGCGLFGTCGGARACSIEMCKDLYMRAWGHAGVAEATKATGTRLSSYERIFLRSCFCIVMAPVAGARAKSRCAEVRFGLSYLSLTGEVPWPPLNSRYRGLLLLRGALGFVAVP